MNKNPEAVCSTFICKTAGFMFKNYAVINDSVCFCTSYSKSLIADSSHPGSTEDSRALTNAVNA